MNNTKRLIALLLVLCLSLFAFAACSGDEELDLGSSQAESESESKAELFEGLPDKKYGGSVVFLVPGDYFQLYASNEIIAQETAPDLLNNEIKKRNEMVEARFDVKIEEVRTTSESAMLELIRIESLATSGAYDIVMPYIPQAATLATEKMFYDLSECQYIDLKNPCWDQNALESMSIKNKTYFATGDISLLSLACTHTMVFNKDIIRENGLESPYDLVESGNWTIDKLAEMAAGITADIDGVDGMSCNDRYGFLVNNNFVTSLFVGAGKSLVAKDTNDIPYLSIVKDADASATVFTKIYDLVNDSSLCGRIDDTSGTYYSTAVASGQTVWDAATKSVANKLALFRSMAVIDVLDLGEYKCNYGIIPIPKLNAEQESYHSLVSTLYATCVAIPTSCTDKEKSAVIAQAMCEASTETTKTAYFDVILKLRKMQDDESGAMLDKIFNDRVYDLGVIYNWGSIANFMNTVAFSGSQTYTSTLESIKSSAQTAMESTIEIYN